MNHRALPALIALAAASLVLAACAASSSADPIPTPSSPAGHGAVDGASEMSEPQLGLVIVDRDGGMTHLDLLDESVEDLDAVPAPLDAATDGRYVFTVGSDGVSITDSGRWTWDHRDHFHYYLAEPRTLGAVDGSGPATIATTSSSTTGGTGVFFTQTGEAVLLDTHALSEGRIVELFRVSVEPHDGLVVPIGSFALVTQSRGGVATSVAVVDQHGSPIPGLTAECADAKGTITTRVGAIVGCADGALLATLSEGTVEFERIPYPAGTTGGSATEFAGRDGRPTVAAMAGDAGVWLLDSRERSWTLLPTAVPIISVTAVDDEAGHVLALSSDGRMIVIDGATGATLSMTEPLAARSLQDASATLLVDQSRAYVSAPADGVIYEIDFADSARTARTFPIAPDAAFVLGTGR